jgi:hypothetical protein
MNFIQSTDDKALHTELHTIKNLNFIQIIVQTQSHVNKAWTSSKLYSELNFALFKPELHPNYSLQANVLMPVELLLGNRTQHLKLWELWKLISKFARGQKHPKFPPSTHPTTQIQWWLLQIAIKECGVEHSKTIQIILSMYKCVHLTSREVSCILSINHPSPQLTLKSRCFLLKALIINIVMCFMPLNATTIFAHKWVCKW